jgi:hypothetical protein
MLGCSMNPLLLIAIGGEVVRIALENIGSIERPVCISSHYVAEVQLLRVVKN